MWLEWYNGTESGLCRSDEFSLGVLNLKDYVPYSYWGNEIWNLEALVRAFSEWCYNI